MLVEKFGWKNFVKFLADWWEFFYQKKDDEDAHLDFEISFFRCSESGPINQSQILFLKIKKKWKFWN